MIFEGIIALQIKPNEKKSLSRQAKAKLETAIRHRINAGRVAIKGQITFFRRHFGQVSSD